MIQHSNGRWLAWRAIATLFLWFGAAGTVATAATDPSPEAEAAATKAAVSSVVGFESEAPPPTAPVIIDGITLFKVRGISAYPAEKRAAAIAGRIVEIAGDAGIAIDQLRILETEDMAKILAGDRLVMGIFDADSRVEGVRRRVLALAYLTQIVNAVKAYRHDRASPVLLEHALHALGATGLWLAVLLLLRMGLRRLDAMVERRFRARIQALKIQSIEIVQAEKLWRMIHAILRAAWGLLVAASTYLYLDYALTLFPWTRALAQQLLDLILQPLVTLGSGILAALPGLLFIALLIAITQYLLKLMRMFFEAAHNGRLQLSGFDADWSWPTYRLIRLLVIAFAVVVAYPYIPGSESAAFKGISIFLGVMLSLGSSTALANVVAGYTMTYRRAFKVDDRVRVGEHIGDVVQRRLLVTHLRTPKNEEVVIPNSVILNNPIVNYSSVARERGLILHTTVGIGYETPWRQVEAMLLEAAERTTELLREPKPFVHQKSLGDFCVVYEINAYCDKPQEMGYLYTRLHQNILDLFNEYGIQIMTPAYEGDPEQPKVVPRDQWFAAPARAPAGEARG
jgi:small-conductance mechanosensitive channel